MSLSVIKRLPVVCRLRSSLKKNKGGIDDEIKIGILHEFARRYTDRSYRKRFC